MDEQGAGMAQQISISKLDDTTYEVAVTGGSPSTHMVTVPPDYAARIAGSATAEALLRASFEFLLARESNTSILRRFDLTVISRYFPEYEREMGRLLKG
jgi:hypothetical protein